MDKKEANSPLKSPTKAPAANPKQSPSKKPENNVIKTESSEDDEILDEISIESKIKQLSPTKYFQKRTSFDYMSLKAIEKPIRRASAIDSGLGAIGNLKDLIKNADNLVKFSTITEEIKTEENENTLKKVRNDKPRRSILKNTFTEEVLVLAKVFNPKTLTELIERIDKICGKNAQLYNEQIPKCFLEFWKNNENNIKKCWLLLQGINQDYLRVVFHDGIENKLLLSICTVFRAHFNENVEFVMSFLENFTKVRRFKFSISCLSKKEMSDINSLFVELQKNKNVDPKRLDELKKVYEL